jgi:hypothetical protein
MSEQKDKIPQLINIKVEVTDERLTGTDKAVQMNNVSFPAEYIDTGNAAQVLNAVAFINLSLSEIFNQKFLATSQLQQEK